MKPSWRRRSAFWAFCQYEFFEQWGPAQGLRGKAGDPDHRGYSHLCRPGQRRMCGHIRSCFFWMKSWCPNSSRACRRTRSAPPGSSGGNPLYDWDAWKRRILNGGGSGSWPPAGFMTLCASTILSESQVLCSALGGEGQCERHLQAGAGQEADRRDQ